MSLRWNMKQLDCLNIYQIQFPNYSIGTIKEFKCENTHYTSELSLPSPAFYISSITLSKLLPEMT